MDRRKKGCPNETCEMFHKKHKYNMQNEYCPKCGTKLVLVCSQCFCRIEDLGPKHRICASCEAGNAAKVQKVKQAGKVILAAPAVGLAAVKAGKEMLKDSKELINIISNIRK